jgi:hypothetical protein
MWRTSIYPQLSWPRKTILTLGSLATHLLSFAMGGHTLPKRPNLSVPSQWVKSPAQQLPTPTHLRNFTFASVLFSLVCTHEKGPWARFDDCSNIRNPGLLGNRAGLLLCATTLCVLFVLNTDILVPCSLRTSSRISNISRPPWSLCTDTGTAHLAPARHHPM